MAGEARELGAGRQAWRQFVDETMAAGDHSLTPYVLAQVCLLTDTTVSTPNERPIEGLPGGRPDRATINAAATALLGYGDQRSDDIGRVWQVLGRMRAFGYYKAVESENRTMEEMLDGMRAATAAGAALGPRFEAWVHLRLARLMREGLHDQDGYDAAEYALRLLLDMPPDRREEPHPVLLAATGGASWLMPAGQMSVLLEYRARTWVAIEARMLRRYERAAFERDQAIVLARQLRDQPMILSQAYGERADLARSLGDVATALQLLAEQRAHAERSGSRLVYLRHLMTAAGFAVQFDDWAEALRLRRARITGRFAELLGIETSAEDPTEVLALIPALQAAGLQSAATAVGNDAYEIARYLIDSGRAETDPAARRHAVVWLDVSDAAWTDIAVNGAVATRFRRIELAALGGEGDPREIGRAMIDLSRRWRRVPGRRRSAIKATRYGDPTDPAILNWLRELTDDAPTVDRAHLALGMARWHLRNGEAAWSAGDPGSAAASWSEAERQAMAAVGGLTLSQPGTPDVPLDATAVVDAYQVRGRALRHLRQLVGNPVAARAELSARLESLPAIARRFTASGSPSQRAVLDRLYRRWLVETLELAVELQDPEAADVTAEVLRRDLVGTVLYGMTHDPNTPEQIARLAEQVIAATGAKAADTEEPSDPPPLTGTRGDDDVQLRGATIAEQLAGALDVVGDILGPVARDLFDPQSVTRHTARTAASALYGDGPGAVLSLVLLAGEQVRVLRRLRWRMATGEPCRDELDIVEAPAWLPELSPGEDQDAFFARLALLTDTLLPAPLIDALSATAQDQPFPLAIVPTGLMSIPFAALRAGGLLVLERAVVAVAQSLQAIESLATARTDSTGGLELAVYDTTGLRHAGQELAALRRHRPSVRNAATLAEIKQLLGDPAVGRAPGLLALAIHGMPGRDGWTQAKRLPSGESVTPGHVLCWYVPTLVVGASCNTDIRIDSGGELGGFPLAFQLRGAVNIVGSLHYIEDAATAEIMSLFYEGTAAGSGTALALRAAQLQWIAEDRAGRLSAYQRWAYLVTYGLPTVESNQDVLATRNPR
jgi:hypothetical protein